MVRMVSDGAVVGDVRSVENLRELELEMTMMG